MTIRKVFRGIAAVTYASLAAAAGAAGAYRIDTLRHTPATEPVRVSGATESIGISSCQDISRPGTYVLTRDLEAPAGSDCIKVLAAGVTLDLDGFSIRGTSSRAGAGINANAAGADDFSARNGAISGFWIGAVLKSVISLRLMPRADGLGRVPAAEVLIRTNYVRECIENKEKTKYIKDAIQQGTSQYGMQTFDQSLYSLYKSGLITLEEALKRATNPNEFKLKIQGIQSTADMSREEMDSALEVPSDFNPLQEESPFDFSNQPPSARG